MHAQCRTVYNDAKKHYCYNAIPYLGKERDAPGVNLRGQTVKNLVEPIKGTNLNATCDCHFMSVDLFEEPHSNNVTAVDTVMPNRRHLPLLLLPKQARGCEVGSSLFAFKDNLTMFLGIQSDQNLYFYCHLCFITAILLKASNQRL